MNLSSQFKFELTNIHNPAMRCHVMQFLDTVVPSYFVEVPASSTGKYHPWYSAGFGGLLRHTKAAVQVAIDLLSLDQYSHLNKDAIIAALVLHDSFKYGGVPCQQFTVFDHPVIAAAKIRAYAKEHNFDAFNTVADLVASHSGQWNTNAKNVRAPKLPLPQTEEAKFVHMCDYLVSRQNIIVELRS